MMMKKNDISVLITTYTPRLHAVVLLTSTMMLLLAVLATSDCPGTPGVRLNYGNQVQRINADCVGCPDACCKIVGGVAWDFTTNIGEMQGCWCQRSQL